jgi:hypothetical protein
MKAISCRSNILFNGEVGTARCRMSFSDMISCRLQISSILKLQLRMEDGKDIIILCTVWPDHTKELNKGIIAVDDSVSFQETKPWIKCSCKVIYPNRYPLISYLNYPLNFRY